MNTMILHLDLSRPFSRGALENCPRLSKRNATLVCKYVGKKGARNAVLIVDPKKDWLLLFGTTERQWKNCGAPRNGSPRRKKAPRVTLDPYSVGIPSALARTLSAHGRYCSLARSNGVGGPFCRSREDKGSLSVVLVMRSARLLRTVFRFTMTALQRSSGKTR
jgi:hypothetical protein